MLTLDAALQLPRLPGALASETALVQRWLRERGAAYEGFDFNIKVGAGAQPADNLPEPWRSLRLEQSKRLIDVVAYHATGIDLLECKGKADPCAVGQIRVYSRFWNREHPNQPVTSTGLICAILDDDMAFALLFEGITAFVYPDLVGVIRRT